MDVANRLMSSLCSSEELWDSASRLPPSALPPETRMLFRLLKSHFRSHGVVPDAETLSQVMRNLGWETDRRQETLTSFMSLAASSAEATTWEIEELIRRFREAGMFLRVREILRAMKGESIPLGRKKVTGVDGAEELLNAPLALIEAAVREELDPYEAYERRKQGGVFVSIPLLESLVPSFEREELWILSGFAGDGKTTFGMNTVLSAADAGASCVLITAEVPAHVMYWKLAVMESEKHPPMLNYHAVKRVKLLPDEEEHFKLLLEKVRGKIRVIGVTAGSNIREVSRICRSLEKEDELDLVLVDYLGLFRDETRFRDKFERLAEVVRQLKTFAQSSNVVMMVLHQTSRGGHAEAVKQGRYTLDALSDTNAAEKHTDGVLWILRTGHLMSKVGLMKYRDEPVDLEIAGDFALSKETMTFAPTIRTTEPAAMQAIDTLPIDDD